VPGSIHCKKTSEFRFGHQSRELKEPKQRRVNRTVPSDYSVLLQDHHSVQMDHLCWNGHGCLQLQDLLGGLFTRHELGVLELSFRVPAQVFREILDMVPLPWPHFCLCCSLEMHALESVSENILLPVLS